MRSAWLVVLSLAVALILQLTLLNRLQLPGTGVPDLVLVLVAAVGVAGGPLAGAVTGFFAGLAADLAPPGSLAIGQYALIFCLAGWAAGRLRPAVNRSERHLAGLVGTAVVAVVVAAAELAAVLLGKLLSPASESLQQVHLALPASVAYDWALIPVVLPLVMLAAALLAVRRKDLPVGAPALAGATRSRREARRATPVPDLHLRQARPGAGWLSVGQAMAAVPARPGVRHARLRPAAGVPGSASGLGRPHVLKTPGPSSLRLARGRPHDGVIGTGLQALLSARQPGVISGRGRTFRPVPGEPGGSAAPVMVPRAAPRGRKPARIRFGGAQPRTASPQLPVAARRPGAAGRPATVPSIRFSGSDAGHGMSRRPTAAPRFNRRSAGHAGLIGGGVLAADSVLAARRPQASPRLKLSGTAPGMLGGSGYSLLRTPPDRPAKQPVFSHGRHSPLSRLTGPRPGSRSGVSHIGRRAGGE